MNQLEFFKRLDAANDVQSIRNRLASGQYSPPYDGMAREWLRIKDSAVADVAASKRDAREERTLAIAEDALSIAKVANRIASEDLAVAKDSATSARRNARWALYAAVTAVVAAIIAAKDQIYALISGHP